MTNVQRFVNKHMASQLDAGQLKGVKERYFKPEK